MKKMNSERKVVERCKEHKGVQKKFFFFFFFFAPGRKCCNGISQGSNHSVPRAITPTNNLCSLELSSGLHRGKCLWPPLLLEHQDCERPKPEGRPPSGDQSDPKATGSLRRENKDTL